MPFLLDTTALSEPVRRSPDPGFMSRLAAAPVLDLFTSSICVMELRHGCALKGDPALWDRIQRDILGQLQVLPFGQDEALRCGEILAALSRAGTPIGIEDAQIASTALVHDLTVVTANIKHFQRIPGLRVENWQSRAAGG